MHIMTSMSSTDGMDIGRIGQFKIASLLKEGRTYQNRWSLDYQKLMYRMFLYIEATQTSTFCQKSATYLSLKIGRKEGGGGVNDDYSCCGYMSPISNPALSTLPML